MPTGWQGGTRRSSLPRDWWRIRWHVLQRDRHRCQLADPGCAGTATEVDHIGARDDHRPGNLRSVCRPCHQRRSSGQGGAAAGRARAARVAVRKRPAERHPGLVDSEECPHRSW